MSTRRNLGNLRLLRLWHDNSGSGPFAGWYCSRVVVIDHQTSIHYPFIVDKWLSVDEDDGVIERTVPLSSRLELTEFRTMIARRAKTQLTDGHLFVSLFTRPPRSRFTRVQRLFCIFALIVSAMMASAMYYDRTQESSGSQTSKMGPFIFGMKQVAVGIIAALIAFPINLLIVHLFRKSRYMHKRPNHVRDALQRQHHQHLPPLRVDNNDYDPYKHQRGNYCYRIMSSTLPWIFRPVR